MNTRGFRRPDNGPHEATKGASSGEVFTITTAVDSLRDDQSRRVRRYLIQMTIRLACFVGAIFAHGVLMWILLACAVVLPYVAVVGANAGRERRDMGGPLMEYRQLPTAATPRPPATDEGTPPVRNPA